MRVLLGEPPVADIVTPPAARAPPGGPELEGFLRDTRRSCCACSSRRPATAEREPMAERSRAALPAGRLSGRRRRQRPGRDAGQLLPAPPGHRPCRHLGRPVPGGMFRRFPFFQRLLSWTKPYAPVPRDAASTTGTTGTACCRGARERAIMPELMDGSSSFPSRPEMESNLATFCERTAPPDPLRLPLGVDKRATARVSCCTPATATTAARSASSLSAWPSPGSPIRRA